MSRRSKGVDLRIVFDFAVVFDFAGVLSQWEPAAVVQRTLPQRAPDIATARQLTSDMPVALRPMPDTVALLRRLRDAGQRLYFLSNMPLPYAEHLERAHDFVGWFHDGVISARVRQIKPEREIFEIAALRFGARPSQLVFIDDVVANVHAARAAGWNAVHFVDVADCEVQLRRHGWV